MRLKLQKGLTLIELIISIVIISASLTGILSVMNLTNAHSADPLINHQALAIAESYLEEILLLAINDPDGTETGETRATFDDVDDFEVLNLADVEDQNGLTVSSLMDYKVSISVSDVTVNTVSLKQVIVSVFRNGAEIIALTGYKAP